MARIVLVHGAFNELWGPRPEPYLNAGVTGAALAAALGGANPPPE